MEAQIIDAALSLGVVGAGVARLDEVLRSPSHQTEPPVEWHRKTGSILVIALAHPPTEPRLDWWDGSKGTPGNRKLMDITRILEKRLKEEFEIPAHDLPYHVEKGGLFLKDAAVLGGLGVIGKNNLMITPDLGPDVRFRAMYLHKTFDSTGPVDVEFCSRCAMPCRQRCPQNAFESGVYSRNACQRQMSRDVENRSVIVDSQEHPDPRAVIKYCRMCELSCPVGSNSAQTIT
jgi:epoxyqueuosine reductase